MPADTLLPFSFPAIKPKKVIVAFDGGRLLSAGGVTLLALAERRVGIIQRLSKLFPDDPDQDRVTHPVDRIVGTRVFAIGCGHEDGNDLDWLREDPAFKLACGRLPDSGHDLCSQPTISRLENAPCLKDVGLFHNAFLVPGRGALARWLAHAVDNDVELTGASDHLISEAIYLDDPEGNGIEIYRDRNRAEWVLYLHFLPQGQFPLRADCDEKVRTNTWHRNSLERRSSKSYFKKRNSKNLLILKFTSKTVEHFQVPQTFSSQSAIRWCNGPVLS